MEENGNKKFVQCTYHIKDALNLGCYCCQGPVDHEIGKHELPIGSSNHKVETVGLWYPTFEEAHRAYKELTK
jgi:hypothetical protein